MSDQKYTEGTRIIVSQDPLESSDKTYSGMAGIVVAMAHRNGDREVYRVKLDDHDYPHNFYDEDLLPHNELEALRVQLAQAEAKVVELKEAIMVKERDAEALPVATVVTYKDRFGPAAITKQAEGTWLNLFPTDEGNPDTELLNDREVTQFLANHRTAVVRKP